MSDEKATIVFGQYEVNVVVNGKIVRSFNLMSDDYAYTNAKEYAAKLNEKANNKN